MIRRRGIPRRLMTTTSHTPSSHIVSFSYFLFVSVDSELELLLLHSHLSEAVTPKIQQQPPARIKSPLLNTLSIRDVVHPYGEFPSRTNERNERSIHAIRQPREDPCLASSTFLTCLHHLLWCGPHRFLLYRVCGIDSLYITFYNPTCRRLRHDHSRHRRRCGGTWSWRTWRESLRRGSR